MYTGRTGRTVHAASRARVVLQALVLVLVAALPAGRGGAPTALGSAPAPSQLSAQAIVQLVGLSFDPTPVEIDAGDTVEWQNAGGFHNVVADDGSFSNGPPSDAWTSFSHTFTAPGTYRYYCSQHGDANGVGMSGVVVVRDPAATQKVYLPLIGT